MTLDKLNNSASDPYVRQESALEYIALAWAEAREEGVSSDALSEAALFAALSSMVTQYGESAVIELVEKLPTTIALGEYTVRTSLQ